MKDEFIMQTISDFQKIQQKQLDEVAILKKQLKEEEEKDSGFDSDKIEQIKRLIDGKLQVVKVYQISVSQLLSND